MSYGSDQRLQQGDAERRAVAVHEQGVPIRRTGLGRHCRSDSARTRAVLDDELSAHPFGNLAGDQSRRDVRDAARSEAHHDADRLGWKLRRCRAGEAGGRGEEGQCDECPAGRSGPGDHVVSLPLIFACPIRAKGGHSRPPAASRCAPLLQACGLPLAGIRAAAECPTPSRSPDPTGCNASKLMSAPCELMSVPAHHPGSPAAPLILPEPSPQPGPSCARARAVPRGTASCRPWAAIPRASRCLRSPF